MTRVPVHVRARLRRDAGLGGGEQHRGPAQLGKAPRAAFGQVAGMLRDVHGEVRHAILEPEQIARAVHLQLRQPPA